MAEVSVSVLDVEEENAINVFYNIVNKYLNIKFNFLNFLKLFL